jgi:Holliday junction resolvase RusA-like endonuclease
MNSTRFHLRFFAPGVPQPGGSKKGFVVPGKDGGKPRAIIVEDAKRNKDWRASVALAASKQMEGRVPAGRVPLFLRITFVMPRPRGHYRTGRHSNELRPDAPAYHTSKPDLTKLTRSTEDALTGIVWTDDSAIAVQELEKVYTSQDRPICGAEILVEEIEL